MVNGFRDVIAYTADVPPVRHCQLYARDGAFYVVPQSRTIDGIWIAVDPMTRLDGEADEVALGNAVLAALAVSGDGVPRPPTPRAVTENLLRFVGQRSWSTFARTAGLVEARLEKEGRVRLIPFARAARGAYEGVDGAATSVPADGEAVGRGVRAALAAAASPACGGRVRGRPAAPDA